MKKQILIYISVFIASVCSATLIQATIEWKETSHNFGNIPQGKEVSYEFEFKNPGMIPLIIQKVETGCGCTASDYPKEPVAPGKSGKIKITYDAKNSGYFIKEINVYSNTQEKISSLEIKGTVNKKNEN